MACKTIMITSFKGGVGKSTVAANLALGLALDGHLTLLIDCDFRMRCLDVLLGCEDYILYNVNDALQGRIKIEQACVTDIRSDNLLFCPAPYNFQGGIDEKAFKAAINRAKEAINPEYIILDTPGTSGQELKAISASCDMAYIVANHSFTSVRAAECTGDELEELGVKDRRLIINMFDMKKNKRGEDILEVIDKTRIRLIGILPMDSVFSEGQDRGMLYDTLKRHNISKAFENIVDRTNGKNVPLFTGFKKINRTKILNR